MKLLSFSSAYKKGTKDRCICVWKSTWIWYDHFRIPKCQHMQEQLGKCQCLYWSITNERGNFTCSSVLFVDNWWLQTFLPSFLLVIVAFSGHCKPVEFEVQVRVHNGYKDRYKKQRRVLNWFLRKRKLISLAGYGQTSSLSSIQSDFIGYEKFGMPRVRSSGCCSL